MKMVAFDDTEYRKHQIYFGEEPHNPSSSSSTTITTTNTTHTTPTRVIQTEVKKNLPVSIPLVTKCASRRHHHPRLATGHPHAPATSDFKVRFAYISSFLRRFLEPTPPPTTATTPRAATHDPLSRHASHCHQVHSPPPPLSLLPLSPRLSWDTNV